MLEDTMNGVGGQLSAEAEGALLQQFENFAVEHGKNYASLEEKTLRFSVFKENLKEIERLTAQETGSTVYGVNQFSDLTHDEYESTLTGFSLPLDWQTAADPEENEEGDEEDSTDKADPSSKFDWRKNNTAYPPVDDQGHCGSCWTFGTVGAVEVLYSKTTEKVTKFSKQQFIDCTKECNGCFGGSLEPAFDLMKSWGLTLEEEYPYKAKNQTCPTNLKSVVKLKSYENASSDEKVYKALPRSPIAVAFDVSPPELKHYVSGIVNPKGCRNITNHIAVIIGYGPDYYTVRNSWGVKYGEKGHVRIKKGACFIAQCGLSITL